jgi:hypothetical protein
LWDCSRARIQVSLYDSELSVKALTKIGKTMVEVAKPEEVKAKL